MGTGTLRYCQICHWQIADREYEMEDGRIVHVDCGRRAEQAEPVFSIGYD